MLRTIGYIVLVIILIILLPIIIPIVAISERIDYRRKKRIADDTACVECGNILGEAAILESNRVVDKEFQEFRIKYPGIKRRTIRGHHAICTVCGQKYFYSDRERAFQPVPPSSPDS